ncbi:hypothetical protein RRG08_014698 [Elysia crispata]|uniref:Uncharacterized protein n=1 Tax=Elysia crispata TaxID=231223 RepID=A0AAE1CYW3_9GAST|nr:hypothetical protein RRG08_014698 [Elysia crispata]
MVLCVCRDFRYQSELWCSVCAWIPATSQNCDALCVHGSPLPVRTVVLFVCRNSRYQSELWCSVCAGIPATSQNYGSLCSGIPATTQNYGALCVQGSLLPIRTVVLWMCRDPCYQSQL